MTRVKSSDTPIEAIWMRGGTSKGLFVRADDLPRDYDDRMKLLARLVGSPDPYGRQTDGLGGATTSTSKVVVLSRSKRFRHDIDYWFGQVDIATGLIDSSGSCGNLAAAVGPAAVWLKLLEPQSERAALRIWQVNVGHTIESRFALKDGRPVESGDFAEAGVPFPGAEIELTFFEPDGDVPLLPTGRSTDRLKGAFGEIDASLVAIGNPMVFVRAADLGLNASEDAARIDGDAALLARLEAIRAAGAVAMGLAATPEEATRYRPAAPKIAWVAEPHDMPVSTGAVVLAAELDVCARMLSMGALHHAFAGTAAVALAVAAKLPGSVVADVTRVDIGDRHLMLGHRSGVLRLSAQVSDNDDGHWSMHNTRLSRSARRLMQGWVTPT